MTAQLGGDQPWGVREGFLDKGVMSELDVEVEGPENLEAF